MSSLRKTQIGTTHVFAMCRGCEMTWDDYQTAVSDAREHAEVTGHTVHVERCQIWTYKRAS